MGQGRPSTRRAAGREPLAIPGRSMRHLAQGAKTTVADGVAEAGPPAAGLGAGFAGGDSRTFVVLRLTYAIGAASVRIMQRMPGYVTPDGKRWSAKLRQARQAVEQAESRRDELVRAALADGVGVRGVAIALGIDKGTVSRRYGGAR